MSRADALHALQRTPSNVSGAWSRVETRFGVFHVAALDGAIVQTSLPGASTDEFLRALQERHPATVFREQPDDELVHRATAQLEEYAAGARRSFDLPLHLEGSAFQTKVWRALSNIPFGETRSYQDIAREVGRPGASRAVGQANHHNPLAPIVPCHRVVTSTGLLGGYGGGVELKRTLLRHEGVHLE